MQKERTGYPSIDKTHLNGTKFLERHPIIPNMSVANAISLMSLSYRNQTSLDCLDLKINYDELINNAAVLSKSFKELGIKKDDIITVDMSNFYQAVAIYLAANRIGAVTTFLNPASDIKEVEYYLNHFESPLLINYDKDADYNKSIKNNTKVRQIITLKSQDLNKKEFIENSDNLIGYSDYLSFHDMKLVGNFYKKPYFTLYNGKQNSLILFTSGSTGNPKLVVLTNENILASGIYMKNTGRINATVGEKCLAAVPFCYPYGFVTSTLMSLMCGREAILAPDISKDNIGYYLQKNPNYVFGSPALLQLIKNNIPINQDLSSIHSFVTGGDFLTPTQYIEGKEYFKAHNSDAEIYNGSGNAETVGTNTMAVGAKVKFDTVGKVLVGTDAIIIDQDTGRELKYGEEGILCIAGKHVFKEYFGDYQLTEESKFNYKGKQYYKTGTVGTLDCDGYFNLIGRSSRFYIRSDLNKVYCEKVQKIISSIDFVENCIVVPKQNDDLLYVGKAFIVLKKGVINDNKVIEVISSKCREPIIDSATGTILQLKSCEIPTSFSIVENISLNKSDKSDYSHFEKLAQEEYEKETKIIVKWRK